MENNKFNIIFFSVLSFVILIGTWSIASAISDKPIPISEESNYSYNEPVNEPEPEYTPELFTIEDLSMYFGVPEEVIDKLGPKSTDVASDVYSGMPYIKIGSTVYFPKRAIDEWLKNSNGLNVE
jgi:hypothetical protein